MLFAMMHKPLSASAELRRGQPFGDSGFDGSVDVETACVPPAQAIVARRVTH